MELTIIIPVKNELNNLNNLISNIKIFREAINFLFVDANSNDGSYELLVRNNFHVIRQNPSGIYAAFNFGIQNTNTKYCMFLGSDDSLLPGINILVNKLYKLEFCMMVCQSCILPDNIITKHKYHYSNLINTNFCHQSIIYNTNYLKNNLYSLKHNVMGDWLLNLQLISKYQNEIYFSDYIISTYKKGGYSAMNKDPKWQFNHILYKFRYLKISNILKFICCKNG